jgi:plastocyanin
MKLGPRWKLACLVVLALVVLSGMALAFEVALAGPGSPDERPRIASILKDGDDDGEDDNSGQGRGRGRGGDDEHDDHGEDEDGDGDVARPPIPDAELGDVVVEIVDEQFVPASVSLDAGQRITFINLDDDEHTATGLGFDTGTLNPGDWATVTLDKGGEIPYICQFHSEMQGQITVQGDEPVSSASPLASPVARSATPTAGQVTIEIVDFAFDQPELEIPVGTTVTWVNNGQAPHTVTGPFGDSGVIQAGDSFSFTFGEAGTFDYVCQFHPDMTAQISVTD